MGCAAFSYVCRALRFPGAGHEPTPLCLLPTQDGLRLPMRLLRSRGIAAVFAVSLPPAPSPAEKRSVPEAHNLVNFVQQILRQPDMSSPRLDCHLSCVLTVCDIRMCSEQASFAARQCCPATSSRNGLNECDRPLADSRSSDYRVPIGSALAPEIGWKRQICLFP